MNISEKLSQDQKKSDNWQREILPTSLILATVRIY